MKTLLWDHLLAVIERRSGHTAVSWHSRGPHRNSLSYAEFSRRIDSLLGELQARQIGENSVIGICFENTAAFLMGLLAGFRTGAVVVPLDPALSGEEALLITQTLPVSLILGDSDLYERFRNVNAPWVFLDDHGELLRDQVAVRRSKAEKPPGLEDIALTQFTSGSTGKPKAILISRDALFHRSWPLACSLGLDPSDRTLCAVPLSHSHGIDCLALPSLLTGGTLHLKSPANAFPQTTLETIQNDRISFFSSVPSFYDLATKLKLQKQYALSSVKHLFCGSAALSSDTAKEFRRMFGIDIKQGYGLAEVGVICLNLHEEQEVVYSSVGRPIRGMEVRLVGEARSPGDAREINEGELIIRSKAMFSGYLNDPAATAERVREGWLYTQDLVSRDDQGRMYIVGRKSEFINVAGQKVYPAEVESKLAQVEWLRESVVLGEPDPLRGERVIAFLVPTDGESSVELSVDQKKSKESELALILSKQLSAYKIPQRWIWMSSFPKSPLGKVLRNKLKR